MTTNLKLKDLERKAFRSTYQDGLLDISQGGLIASFTAFAGAISGSGEMSSLGRMAIFLAGSGASQLVFWLGKKYLTLPRMGQVTFGPMRKRRARTLATALGIMIAIQMVVVGLSVAFWKIPVLANWAGGINSSQNAERLAVAVIGALFVGPSMALLAYFSDFMRGYYTAAVLSLSVFSMIWFDRVWMLLVGSALILIPGIYLLARFLASHPMPPAEGTRD